MEAVHTGVALALDIDLIITSPSNSDALKVLVLRGMRAAITAEHNIWLLLLDHMKKFGIGVVEVFPIFVQALAHRDLLKGERVEAAYLFQATPGNCLADFVNSIQSITFLHCLAVIGEIELVLCWLLKDNHDTALRFRHGEPFGKLDLLVKIIVSMYLKSAAVTLNCLSMTSRTNEGMRSCKSSREETFDPMINWKPETERRQLKTRHNPFVGRVGQQVGFERMYWHDCIISSCWCLNREGWQGKRLRCSKMQAASSDHLHLSRRQNPVMA